MMVDVCPEHGKFTEKIGKLDGKVDIILSRQDIVFTKLDDIKENLSNAKLVDAVSAASNKAEIEKDRIRLKPVWWFLTVFGTAMITTLLHLAAKYWK
jgi:hypothetical protein